MKKKKRRCITLIEVLVSFSLMAIVVSSLLMYLRRVIFLQSKLQVIEREILSRAHIQRELHSLFSRLEYGKEAEFFTVVEESGPELHFSFLNRVDRDSSFSGRIQGIIRVRGEQLIVEMKPLLKDKYTEPKTRECVLAPRVDSIAWRFVSFDKDSGVISSDLWTSQKSSCPHLFSLLIKINGVEHTFPVFLFKDFSGIFYEVQKAI